MSKLIVCSVAMSLALAATGLQAATKKQDGAADIKWQPLKREDGTPRDNLTNADDRHR
jgi:hypothetical protein